MLSIADTSACVPGLVAAGFVALWTPIARAQDAPASPAALGGGTAAALGLRVDCTHRADRSRGATQDCLNITGLRYALSHSVSPKVRADLRLDPFASLNPSRSATPLRDDVPLVRDSELAVVDRYALVWAARPNLDVAIESYEGAAKLTSVSGLALTNPFGDAGWTQTALSLTYQLATLRDMRVKFVAGNGEGENGRNLDPQQYFGFEVGATVIRGLRADIGMSLDGNSIGSAEDRFLMARYQRDCGYTPPKDRSKLGYSSQRLAVGLSLDGNFPGAEGLKVGLGWQRQQLTDLDKRTQAYPSLAELGGCTRLPVETLFVEDERDAGLNTVQRSVYELSASYRFLGSYTVGVDYATRQIDTGKVNAFAHCEAYSGGSCSTPGTSTRQLTQTAFAFGLGTDLAEGLALSLEYAKLGYDRKYAKFFYDGPNDKAADSQDVFNARVAYNWR